MRMICGLRSEAYSRAWRAVLCVSSLSGFLGTVCAANTLGAAPVHDGSHDFDFNRGKWRTHIRRVLDPLSGGSHSIEQNGTVTVRGIWGGRAQLEEIEADGPNGHWQGMTLFLYDPAAHQWSQIFSNSTDGQLAAPLIGEFSNGHGDLYATDTFQGRTILVRGTWSSITSDAHHYEEDYSADGGTTWWPAFIADLTRLAPAEAVDAAMARSLHTAGSDATPAAASGGGHDFDFDFGRWKMHSWRLQHPLSGSTAHYEMTGTTTTYPVWGGKANLAEVELNGPKGRLQLVSLRLYNPKSGEWSQNFATSAVGVLNVTGGASVPMIGRFSGSRGTFYDQEQFEGRTIWVRFMIQPISPMTAHSEQAFSADNGRTWETNWTNDYTRIPDTP